MKLSTMSSDNLGRDVTRKIRVWSTTTVVLTSKYNRGRRCNFESKKSHCMFVAVRYCLKILMGLYEQIAYSLSVVVHGVLDIQENNADIENSTFIQALSYVD